MNDPVFVRTSAEPLPSYGDFWRLVELSGFRSVAPGQVDLGSREFYVFPTFDMEMMACLDRVPKGRRACGTAFWYLERPDANLRPGMDAAGTYREAVGQILGWVNEFWTQDRRVSGFDDRNVFVPIGGHEGLREREESKPDFHSRVVHVGQVTPRRKKILDELAERGVGCRATYWADRSSALSSSTLMIGIDRVEGLHLSNGLRWALAAAYRLPVLHEEVEDPFPLSKDGSILMVGYDRLALTAVEVLGRPNLRSVGNMAWEVYCREWTFRRSVMKAVRGL